MKTREIEIAIASFLVAKKNLLLIGQPGSGKSCLITAGIEQAGLTHCIINGAICDPLDAKGALWVDPETKQAFYVPIGVLNDILDGKIDVVFLDDITQSPMSVQNGLMQWVEARYIGDRKIPDNVRFIAAGNRPEDRSGVQPVSMALLDRFTVLHVEPDHKGWLTWAIPAGIDPMVTSFVAKKNGEGFCDFKPNKSFDQNPSCRGYERCHDIIGMGLPLPVQRACFIGAVGEGIAAELSGHMAVFNDLPNWEDVLDDPEGIDIPESSSALYALANSLIRAVLDDDKRSANAFRFAERMCEDGNIEIATFIAQTIYMVDKKVEEDTGTDPKHCKGKAFNRLASGPLADMLHG